MICAIIQRATKKVINKGKMARISSNSAEFLLSESRKDTQHKDIYANEDNGRVK